MQVWKQPQLLNMNKLILFIAYFLFSWQLYILNLFCLCMKANIPHCSGPISILLHKVGTLFFTRQLKWDGIVYFTSALWFLSKIKFAKNHYVVCGLVRTRLLSCRAIQTSHPEMLLSAAVCKIKWGEKKHNYTDLHLRIVSLVFMQLCN